MIEPVDKYNEIAPMYDQRYDTEACHLEDKQLADLLEPHIGGNVLDIGCGTGLLVETIAIPPEQYLGIDPSPEMLRIFKAKHPDYPVQCSSYEQYDASVSHDSLIALYGVATYIQPNYYEKMRTQAKNGSYFLMFYKPNYLPDFYTEEEKADIRNIVSYPLALHTFQKLYEFNKYLIATNVQLELNVWAMRHRP